MKIRFSSNQGYLRSFSHIVLITLLILLHWQTISFFPVNISTGNASHIIAQFRPKLHESDYQVYVNHSGKTFDGYNIFQFRDFANGRYSFQITDMEGNIISSFPSENNYGYVHLINSTTFLLISTGPSYLWNIETNENITIPFNSLHDISFNPKTNTFITLSSYLIEYFDLIDSTAIYRYDTICEMNMTGDIIWQLNTSSFVPFEWWSATKEFTGSNRDVTHSNTVFWDIEEDLIYLNCRNINTFYKIDHATGEVIWGLGQHGDFTLFDQWGNQRKNLFYHAHALEKVDENTFILFDNDYLNETIDENFRSRILEITIDENTMIANISWVWTGTDEYYTAYWGDADRLPNGNRFGTFGSKTHISSFIGPRLVEVDEFGNIVWEMYYIGGTLGIYKTERFRLSPILGSPEDRLLQTGDSLNLSWLTWYNFRTRLKMNGSYTLYHNRSPVDTGDHVFDKFWRPTILTFHIDPLEKGIHNFTLTVADEGGHITEDTVLIYVDVTPTSTIMTSDSVTIYTTPVFLLGLGILVLTQKKRQK